MEVEYGWGFMTECVERVGNPTAGIAPTPKSGKRRENSDLIRREDI